MIRLTKREREYWDGDTATKQERYWLDEYNRLGFFGCREMRILGSDRNAGGEMCWVHVLMRRRSDGPFGVMPIGLTAVKREVRNLRAAERRRAKKEVRNHIGAYI